MSTITDRRITVSVLFGSLGLSFNTLLAYIIITNNCYIAIYSSCQMTTAATFMLFPDGYALYDIVRLLPVSLGWVFLNIYSATFVQNVVILVHSFTYRYLVICSPRGMDLYVRHWIRVVFVSLLVVGYVDFALIYGLLPSAKCEELFGEKFYQVSGYNILSHGRRP